MQKFVLDFSSITTYFFSKCILFYFRNSCIRSLQTDVCEMASARFDIFNRTVIKNRGHIIVISIPASISISEEASRCEACPSNSASPNANIDLTLIVCCTASSKFRRIRRYIYYIYIDTYTIYIYVYI